MKTGALLIWGGTGWYWARKWRATADRWKTLAERAIAELEAR